MSTLYSWIKDHIRQKTEIEVKYNGPGGQGWRMMWPMLIGQTFALDDVVLCYQPSGPAQYRKWRCLKLSKVLDYREPNNPDNQRPPDLTAQDIQKQNCVNYPDQAP